MAVASRALILSLSSAVALLACSKPAPTPDTKPSATVVVTPPPFVQASPSAEAQEIFTKRCVVCHGAQGMGDGPGAAALQPKPRTFSDAAWQAATKDEHIAKIIVAGGPGVNLSPGMPANPDLVSKPEVVQELVKIVRKWRK